MSGASMAKLVWQKAVLDDGYAQSVWKSIIYVWRLKRPSNFIKFVGGSANWPFVGKAQTPKALQKLVCQIINLVWQKSKLVGQLPHQLNRKLRPRAEPSKLLVTQLRSPSYHHRLKGFISRAVYPTSRRRSGKELGPPPPWNWTLQSAPVAVIV